MWRDHNDTDTETDTDTVIKKQQIDIRHRRLKRTQLHKDTQTKTDTADCDGKDVWHRQSLYSHRLKEIQPTDKDKADRYRDKKLICTDTAGTYFIL
jgi:hypothetical protein